MPDYVIGTALRTNIKCSTCGETNKIRLLDVLGQEDVNCLFCTVPIDVSAPEMQGRFIDEAEAARSIIVRKK
jgi:hypothetical protein